MGEKIEDWTKEDIERGRKRFAKMFWRDIDRQLKQVEAIDGTSNSIHQTLLRAVYILHLQIEKLKGEKR